MGHDQSQTLLELGEIRERERILALVQLMPTFILRDKLVELIKGEN